MPDIIVDTATRTLTAGGRTVPCAIGKNGAVSASEKREGDGKTPLGRWPLRALLLRRDRNEAPQTALPWRWIHADDGWSDDVADLVYNRPVRHPHGFSAERLWREDALYDLIVVIGHNDDPPVPGAGSAIFLHCLAENGRPTEGCVAIDKTELRALANAAAPTDTIEIR